MYTAAVYQAHFTEQLQIDFVHVVNVPRQRKRSLAHQIRAFGLRSETHHGHRQVVPVPRADKIAVDAVNDRIATSGQIGGYHRTRAGEGFQDSAGQTFAIIRWQYEYRTCCEIWSHIVRTGYEIDLVLCRQSLAFGARYARRIFIFAAAYNLKFAMWKVPANKPRSFKKFDDTLVPHQPSDHQKTCRQDDRSAGWKPRERNAGSGNLDHLLMMAYNSKRDHILPIVGIKDEGSLRFRDRCAI